MLHGLGIVLLGHDTLSPALNLLWLGGTLAAAWCIGGSQRAGAAAVLGVALLMATPMMNTSQAGGAGRTSSACSSCSRRSRSCSPAAAGTRRQVLAAVAAGLAVGRS